jgi:hypothetical protein
MYWGCGTPVNRAQWALFTVLSILWIVLWIVSRTEQQRCKVCDVEGQQLVDCKDMQREDWDDFDEATQRAPNELSWALRCVFYSIVEVRISSALHRALG